jgi:hypothetical protein
VLLMVDLRAATLVDDGCFTAACTRRAAIKTYCTWHGAPLTSRWPNWVAGCSTLGMAFGVRVDGVSVGEVGVGGWGALVGNGSSNAVPWRF